jgi:POLO box duplicated region
MNFADHSKVVLWDSARAMRYVDKCGEVYIWSLAEAVTKGSKGEVIERLRLAAKELVMWADLMASGKRGRKA